MEGDVAAMIPPQLCTPEFRFNLVQAKDKRAIEKAWNTEANYKFDHARLQEHLARGGNYGVLTGYNDLAVLDADTPELRAWVEEHLPLTFTVKTSKGAHFYYRTPSLKQKIIFKKGDEHFGELQFKGQYVVGPTCTHSSGAVYEVIADEPIAELSELRIEALRREFTDQKQEPPPRQMKFTPVPGVRPKTADLIKQSVKLRNVLSDYGVDLRINPTKCPLHDDNKPSFSWNDKDDWWNCFACGMGGDVITFVEKSEHVEFTEAIKLLAHRYAIKIDPDPAEQTISNQNLDVDRRVKQLQTEAVQLLAARKTDESIKYIMHAIELKWKIVTIRQDQGDDEMYIYMDGIYKPHAKTYIREFLEETYGEANKPMLLHLTCHHLANRSFVNAEDFFDSAPLHFIPVENGIVDLRTNELIPFNALIYFQSKLPITYDPLADCPAIKEFYREVLRNESDVDVVQEFYGYCLWREYKYPVIFMCLGTGSNGKSKHLELIRLFLGKDNVTSVTVQDIMRDQYSKAELKGKLANIAGDISKKPIEDSSELKAITGGDLVKANRKHMTQIVFVNYAKLIFSANELPPTYDTTEGFFRRWKILDFPHKFYKQVDYDALPENERQHAKIADPEIVEKLSTQTELSGLLNWALEGLVRLNRRKDFSNSKTIAEIERQWYRRSNSFYAFIEEFLVFEPGQRIIKSDLRKVFADYCNQHKLEGVSDKIIAITLEKHGVTAKQQRFDPSHPLSDGDYNHREEVWHGVRWKDGQQDASVPAISYYKPPPPRVLKGTDQVILKGFPVVKEDLSGPVSLSGSPTNYEQSPISRRQKSTLPDSLTTGYNPLTREEELTTRSDFIKKIIRIMCKDSHTQVSFEDVLQQVKVYAENPSSSPFSVDTLEKDVENTLNNLRLNGDIYEPSPGRYRPL